MNEKVNVRVSQRLAMTTKLAESGGWPVQYRQLNAHEVKIGHDLKESQSASRSVFSSTRKILKQKRNEHSSQPDISFKTQSGTKRFKVGKRQVPELKHDKSRNNAEQALATFTDKISKHSSFKSKVVTAHLFGRCRQQAVWQVPRSK